MKYRIKIVTYKDGTVKYFPQYYVGFLFGWSGIGHSGNLYPLTSDTNDYTTRENALICIDRVIAGAGRVKTIEFEYINK